MAERFDLNAAIRELPEFETLVKEEMNGKGNPIPHADEQVKDFPFTDLGNGERLVDRHGADLRYAHLWKQWLIWDGAVWEKDITERIRKLARETVRSLYRDAKILTDLTEQADVGPRKEHLAAKTKALLSHGVRSEATSRIDAMVKEARKDCAIDIVKLDAHPWLLNLSNGTIDLRTGQLRSHQREDLLTKIIPTPYDASASCPLWEQFLWDIMGGNEEVIDFLWKAVGYSLTGDKREDCVFFMYGTGANGKGTFQNTLRILLADYAKAANFSTFLHREYETVRNDLADLCGARFVTAGEPDQGQRLSEAIVKQITGWDPLKARFLFQELFEFVPQMKCWLAFNFKPVIKGQDHGIWRRIRLIPFNQKFEGDRKDETLREKLLTELPGILAWAIRGAAAWYEDGLPIPDAVRVATNTYQTEMDQFGSWLVERCEQKSHLRCKVVDLYNDFIAWSGEKYFTQIAFGKLLTDRGFERWSNRAWITGIGLLEQSFDN